jgi:hypothetical protein
MRYDRKEDNLLALLTLLYELRRAEKRNHPAIC